MWAWGADRDLVCSVLSEDPGPLRQPCFLHSGAWIFGKWPAWAPGQPRPGSGLGGLRQVWAPVWAEAKGRWSPPRRLPRTGAPILGGCQCGRVGARLACRLPEGGGTLTVVSGCVCGAPRPQWYLGSCAAEPASRPPRDAVLRVPA